MTIDVDRCTGCKSCVIACQAENNIPVVGAEFSAMQRVVSWLRIERIHEGAFPHVHADFIPMLCQHCGSAPCESVCPVFASMHTHDGLNAQIYNRCIGTRVCANNCPYHVRMFNFISPTWPKPMDKQLNPDVSVRSEGVMEKCTFCVQRIRRGNLNAKVEKRPVEDGEIRTACVQSCPSQALVFGLLSDPESTISKHLELNKSRATLVHEALETHPHVIYLRPQRATDVLEPVRRALGEEAVSPSPNASASPGPSTSASPSGSGSPTPNASGSPTPSPATPVPTAPASPGMSTRPAVATPAAVSTP
jgi:molybdopterin-containing oxidoreductase family iron-sulfur binding subunit